MPAGAGVAAGTVTTVSAAARFRHAARASGRESLRLLRAHPSSLPTSAAGAWFEPKWRRRLVRRVALVLPLAGLGLPERVAADVAFWAGVGDVATPREWQRLTRSSYVVLCYHRIAGLALPGQERMDVPPAALRAQLRLLRRLGWQHLTPERLLQFHLDPEAVLPRRCFVLTADDGFEEAIAQLTSYGDFRPQVFAVTGSVGGHAGWLGDERLATWGDLRRLQQAGGVLGSHARHHVPLDTLSTPDVEDELVSSLAELRGEVEVGTPVLAYPHGRHDQRVRNAAERAGYAFAYSTAQGRNGAGGDRFALRRVEPKMWDDLLSFAWKVATGESPPSLWERLLVRRWVRGRRAAAARDQRGG